MTINKIIAGGMGLARPDNGKVVMVSGVLPGEVVHVSIVKEHRGYIEAEPVEIITASPARREATCPWYRDCGGCDLQHCAYDAQLDIKKKITREALERAGVPCPDDCLADTMPSPKQLAYRYRLRLQVQADGQTGFHRKGTNTVVPVSRCAVATDKINAALALFQSGALFNRFSLFCREVEVLHSPADDRLTLVLHVRDTKKADPDRLAQLTANNGIDQAAYKTGFQVSGKSLQPLQQDFKLPGLQIPGYRLRWSAGCFYQVNAGQNEQLIQLVCRLAGQVTNSSVLDLYCGMGNFAIPMALLGAAVTGIESNRESTAWAKHNARSLSLNCSFFTADVHAGLRQLVLDKQQVDTIILDPPRRGIGKAARLLPELSARQIIYISCDPATLARDLAALCSRGYSVKKLIPVDMFPQTHHIECVALLKKN